MKTSASILFIALGLIATQPLLADAPATAPASAPAKKADVPHRLHRQGKRIKAGEKSGALTKSDAADLKAEHKGIKDEVKADRAANGGKLSKDQRKQVQGELNTENQNIKADEAKNGVVPAAVPASK